MSDERPDGLSEQEQWVIDRLVYMAGPTYKRETERHVRKLLSAQREQSTALARLREARDREERAHGETINQRDHHHKAADRLAYAIAGEGEIGEHSSMNDPWSNALEHLKAERAEVARLREERDRWQHQATEAMVSALCLRRKLGEFRLAIMGGMGAADAAINQDYRSDELRREAVERLAALSSPSASENTKRATSTGPLT